MIYLVWCWITDEWVQNWKHGTFCSCDEFIIAKPLWCAKFVNSRVRRLRGNCSRPQRAQGLLSLLILFAADKRAPPGLYVYIYIYMVSGIKFSRAPQYLSNVRAANKLRPQDVNYFPAQTFYGRVIFNFIRWRRFWRQQKFFTMWAQEAYCPRANTIKCVKMCEYCTSTSWLNPWLRTHEFNMSIR